jgi:hypothetical protein
MKTLQFIDDNELWKTPILGLKIPLEIMILDK